MFRNLSKFVFGLLGLVLSLSIVSMPAISAAVDYDIVYVRAPRFGDKTNSLWPEVFHPARLDPGADLMLLHPDGSGGSSGCRRAGLGNRSVRIFRWAIMLLRLFSESPTGRIERAARQLAVSRRGYLPDRPSDSQNSKADPPGVHSEHGSRQLGRVQSGGSGGAIRPARLWHLEFGAVRPGRRQGSVRQQSKRLYSSEKLYRADLAIVRDG